MDVRAGHATLEVLAGFDIGRFYVGDKVFLDRTEIAELLVEMARQQQHSVFKFALAAAQGTLTEVVGHDGGADRDCRDQQHAANDQPSDRTAANVVS